MPEEQKKTFDLGLSMAGAISAGAYTAGVVDFLVQALEEWQKAKEASGVDAPTHNVLIPVMSGASAGGITGALAIVALAGGLKQVKFDSNELKKLADRTAGGSNPRSASDIQQFRYYLADLYDTWVRKPRMIPERGDESKHGLLMTHDLRSASDGKVVSMLDGSLLDEMADAALKIDPDAGYKPAYFAKTMHVIVSITNTRGVSYEVKFDGGVGGHGMMNHGDRVHFAIEGIGGTGWSSHWVKHDKAVALNAATLSSGLDLDKPENAGWKTYATAALASGAFPVGLPPRTLTFEAGFYGAKNRNWPMDIPKGVEIKPKLLDHVETTYDYEFVNVDGGLINNEPFELTRWSINRDLPGAEGKRAPRNPREGDKANRAVLMVDPFPAGPEFDPAYEADKTIRAVVARIIPLLKNQARFKASELTLASDGNVYSRFLIAPRRFDYGKKNPEEHAIACGLLGGFGGFLDEGFRDHDFQLGRRNCQRFLAQYFRFPGNNVVFAAAGNAANASEELPMIPLIGTAIPEVVLPDWPRMSIKDFRAFLSQAETRMEHVVKRMIETEFEKGMLKFLIKRAWSWFGRGPAARMIHALVLRDLVRRDQIGGAWRTLSDDARSVAAHCIEPTWKGQPLKEVVRKTKFTQGKVRDLVDAYDGLLEITSVKGVDTVRPLNAPAGARGGFLGRLFGGGLSADKTGIGPDIENEEMESPGD